ncbi:thiolase [Flagelloscypha sp. PMI_526]|nr:thiolase [Flagelloscypha sp. PMI_526]
MERVKQLAASFTGNTVASLEVKRPEDVVITLAIRSPLCKAEKGGFKDAKTDELLVQMFSTAVEKSGINPALIGDICVGTKLSLFQTINRFCSSGLMAVTTISNQIRAGQIDIGLALGVESMSENPDNGGPKPSDEILTNQAAADSQQPMGWTAENVASDFGATSFQRAEAAQKAGYFEKEIDATGEKHKVVVSKDDGIRYGTTKEALGKIRSAFPQVGQITDGAAAVLLMTRKKAEELSLPILAKHISTSVCGVPPRIMGVGPEVAIPKLLDNVGLKADDIDLYEINEAFASQALYCVRKLGLSLKLKHYVGTTGARLIATGLNELHRRQGKLLVTSMCIGTGMGAAGLFVRE